jgi:hypothetical protein
MALATERGLRKAQAGFVRDYKALALLLAAQIGQLLTAAADGNGRIPLQRLQSVQNEAQALTLRLYVDPQQGPYSVSMTPLAEYPRLLNRHIISVTVDVLTGYSDWFQKRPDDIASWLQLGRLRPAPRYDPFHKWLDPRGWDLSQRIWEVGLNTRRKLGDYLDINIRQGRSAVAMAQELEQFLVPGRRNITTPGPYPPPYGVTASFDAMRLARTEISMAHTNASFAAALANPYVAGMDWKLSPRHPKMDICDNLATIGMGGERLKDPYPLDSAPRVVADSHPQCICVNVPALGDLDAINADIRVLIDEGEPPSMQNAFDVQSFATALLGAELSFQIQEALGI